MKVRLEPSVWAVLRLQGAVNPPERMSWQGRGRADAESLRKR